MKINITVILLLVCSLSFSQSPSSWGMNEGEHIPNGLKVGTKAPDLSAKDHHGNRIDLKDLLTKGEVVLLFYRGQWCPVCNRYLSNFQDSVQYILDKGASVIAVTPETSDNAKVTIGNTGMTFSVVSDAEGQIMRAYDVLFHVTEAYQNKIQTHLSTDISNNNGADEALLPVPATYIIGQNGEIKATFFDHNYKKRATVAEILEHL